MITAQIPATHFLTFDYTTASKLILPGYEAVTLALVGCGGTGSWLAPAVVRIGRLLKEKAGKRVNLTFIDPDHVEAKNVYRQNFCEAEIGRNKAETLAFRYGLAWGMEIAAFAVGFDKEMLGGWNSSDHLTVLIGCVDNTAGRSKLEKAVQENTYKPRWWLDCGNSQASGQALLGCGGKRPADPFQLPGYCSWLPLPSVQHPDLTAIPAMIQTDERNLELGEMSCADLAMMDSQGLAVNQRMAAEAADMLTRMLLTRDLTRLATYFDLASGSARSRYITRDEVMKGENGDA